MVNQATNRKKKSSSVPKKSRPQFSVSKEVFSDILTTIQHEVTKLRDQGIGGALLSKQVKEKKIKSPFHVLIGCIVSLRTKDTTTGLVLEKLFKQADNVEAMAELTVEELEQLIYPAGFYRNKAKQIKELCERLILEEKGKVPETINKLLKFKGVGRKTANLVITLGFNKPGICVDTHVRRICHRIGFIQPKKYDQEGKPIFHTADETEMILREKLYKTWWIPINDVLVTWGQTICVPVSPKCSQCVIQVSCARVGVLRSR